MHIDIITLFPEIFPPIFNHSILKRAEQKGIFSVQFHNLRDYSTNNYHSVDDYPYGGEAGMVMQIEPIYNCIEDLKQKRSYDEIIYTSPDGELLDQKLSNSLSLMENICILCGHYKGVDERVRQNLITREISIGNYVLSGGELASMVICDSIVRLIPGVLSDETSALSDSFQDNLVSHPVYSRPQSFNGWEVPKVLLSGNDKLIKQWQEEESLKRTKQRRPNLL
ncbi:MAG: tRNA (guanosine(37)-N1)-methyltransferase TrmD [Bacteroidales bacterium]|jgi:tRNA (guanine37-N1)-methyltransferase|nr:tRNA (guanosine(37)-N1)-methyltransferase TrmD [Bacteroidales bacterium]